MRFVFVILFCLLNSLSTFSQSNDVTFLTIGKQNISAEEFERIFNKNNSISSSDKQTVEEYLPMFINYKLKVQAALDAGLDTLASFRNELKGYRDQLAKSYLTDSKAVDSLVLEAYQRMHTEVNASHIMVSLNQIPSPADTFDAWNKILVIRKRLLNGEPFEKLAAEVSDDPSAKNNNGNLGYFTAFQMVYPFETVAYNCKINEISQPLRSRFGYHLIKTNDKRPAQGEVKVAHIMLMVPQGSPDSAWIIAEKRINELDQKLKSGADFATLAKEHSEDRGSAANGGELPSFGTGRMIPEFETAAFKLKYPGDISEPIKTFYGWHIIKLLDRKGVPDFEEVKQDIKARLLKDERAEFGPGSLVAKLKKEYKFSENLNSLSDLHASDPEKELFSFAGHSYRIGDLIRYHKSTRPNDSIISAESLQSSYGIFVRKVILDFENSQLEAKYPDFKNLIQEYHDGILLFNLSDSVIWSKASKDSAGLSNFYLKNKTNYMWPERLEATIVTCKSDLTPQAIKTVKKLKTVERINNELTKSLCDSSDTACIQLDYRMFVKGDNSFIDSMKWKKGISQILTTNESSQFAVVHNLLKPSPKTLNESRGLVISDYQNHLEKEWLKQLREKYIVNINNEILTQLKNKYAGKN